LYVTTLIVNQGERKVKRTTYPVFYMEFMALST